MQTTYVWNTAEHRARQIVAEWQPGNPLVIERPACRLQHLGNRAITEPTEPTDQLNDIGDQRGSIIGPRWSFALRG